ncbi:GroES-like protein [Glarea lozoyensis ATCC 20868]|uniref:GroES-like protein n=1 Tax=Glarea lozoyensis (strain ATCC 20868 / MF5171) TaxID=1116229 RepID=S3CHM5_GLAL2|nr:GroES-like protein [Glarea lozoyensis ATCC 20868]EPE25345.1 GroES-like protein [Glarea lozoyensis ATCC 20868]
MATMKQVLGFPSAEVKCEIESAPIPEPKDKQVLIKVVVSGSNPKDWKVPTWAAEYNGPDNDSWQTKAKSGMNHGDDIAGVVEKVGKDVIAFKKGDRVGAFHEMQAPGGSYAEYGLAWEHTTFHLPASTSFEEAATIPLAALTAAVAVFKNLKLPTPWLPATESTPFIVYGASSSVGSYAIKLARNSNIHPIIAVAGKGTPHVESLLDRSKGDAVFDYRKGTEETIKGIRAHLKSGKYGEVRHGLDPGIGEPSKQVLTEIVVSDGAINLVLPSDWDTGKIAKTKTTVGSVHTVDNSGSGDNHNLGLVTCRWFTEALEKGTFTAHPYEVRPGGLEAVQQALQDLKDEINTSLSQHQDVHASLSTACRTGDIQTLKDILEDEETGLSLSSVVKLDIKIRDLIRDAVKASQLEVLRFLRPLYPKEFDRHLRMNAIATRSVDVVLELADHDPGFITKSFGIYGCPLRSAVSVPEPKDLAFIRFLLERGADPNDGLYGGMTPLREAAAGGEVEVLRLLVDYGAVMEGSGAMRRAVLGKRKEAVEFLLERGCSPDDLTIRLNDRYRETALLMAVRRERYDDVVKLLIGGAANVHVKDQEGRSVVEIVQLAGNVKIVELLREALRKEREVNED